MLFSDILSQNHVIKLLTESADKGRIPHAQLFIGKSGYGVLPVALALINIYYAETLEVKTKGVKTAVMFSVINITILIYIFFSCCKI